ncbi:MAG: hypothetical protein U1F61_21080 [Opitutaceae bacterium]
MGHHIQAIVGSKHGLEILQQRFGASRVIALGQGLFLLPMLEDIYDARQSVPDTHARTGSFHFRFLDSKIIALLIGPSTRA